MSVSKNGGKKYYVAEFSYLDEQGSWRRVRRSTGCVRKREAEVAELRMKLELMQQAAEARAVAEEGTGRRSAVFSGFATYWLDQVEADLSPSTALSYERCLRLYLVPSFGDLSLREVRGEQVQAFKRRWLRSPDNPKGVAPKTLNNALGVASSMYKRAIEWGYAEDNPFTAVRRLRTPPSTTVFWQQDDSRRFLAHVGRAAPEWLALFTLALRTGLRRGELLALTWTDVQLDARRMAVRRSLVRGRNAEWRIKRTKNNQEAWVDLSPDAVEALRRHPHRLGSDLVFCRADGRAHNADWVSHTVFRRLVDGAGVPRIRFHDLRHTFGSQLAMVGASHRELQGALRHTSPKSTERYVHLTPRRLSSYVDLLDGDHHSGGSK